MRNRAPFFFLLFLLIYFPLRAHSQEDSSDIIVDTNNDTDESDSDTEENSSDDSSKEEETDPAEQHSDGPDLSQPQEKTSQDSFFDESTSETHDDKISERFYEIKMSFDTTMALIDTTNQSVFMEIGYNAQIDTEIAVSNRITETKTRIKVTPDINGLFFNNELVSCNLDIEIKDKPWVTLQAQFQHVKTQDETDKTDKNSTEENESSNREDEKKQNTRTDFALKISAKEILELWHMQCQSVQGNFIHSLGNAEKYFWESFKSTKPSSEKILIESFDEEAGATVDLTIQPYVIDDSEEIQLMMDVSGQGQVQINPIAALTQEEEEDFEETSQNEPQDGTTTTEENTSSVEITKPNASLETKTTTSEEKIKSEEEENTTDNEELSPSQRRKLAREKARKERAERRKQKETKRSLFTSQPETPTTLPSSTNTPISEETKTASSQNTDATIPSKQTEEGDIFNIDNFIDTRDKKQFDQEINIKNLTDNPSSQDTTEKTSDQTDTQ